MRKLLWKKAAITAMAGTMMMMTGCELQGAVNKNQTTSTAATVQTSKTAESSANTQPSSVTPNLSCSFNTNQPTCGGRGITKLSAVVLSVGDSDSFSVISAVPCSDSLSFSDSGSNSDSKACDSFVSTPASPDDTQTGSAAHVFSSADDSF